MKIACVQAEIMRNDAPGNLTHVSEMIRSAAAQGADTILLPEVWNLGFFPGEGLEELADPDGAGVREAMGALAAELCVNIAAGSAVTCRNGKVYNTAYVLDRRGGCIASYDKTHLFSPAAEQKYFNRGDGLCTFHLDGVKCGLIICYDLRFPELTRSLALQGIELLFVPAQWPALRIEHWRTLTRARAIENQIFLACCNGCGPAGRKARYGGYSAVFDPWGRILCEAGESEEIVLAGCDMSTKEEIRCSMNVFEDRRPELYQI